MADGSLKDVPQGRIRREDADQVFMAALICLACGVHDGSDRDLALHLVERCLPLISRATRIEALRPHAESVLITAPGRNERGEGSMQWCRARLELSVALARDALSRAVAKVEV